MPDEDETSWTLADVPTTESDEELKLKAPRSPPCDDSRYPAAYAVALAAVAVYVVLGMRRSST